MKIKNDFITNSSSTSYVLCGPKKILDEDIEELINKVYEDYDHDDDLETIADTSKEELRDRIETIFNNGGGLYQDDELFFAIINLAEEREWVINKSDSAPDAGQISILSNKDIEKIKKIRNLGEGVTMAKYKHYLFSPLLDEKGEPVVRIPNYDEYVMIDDIPVKVIWIPDSTGYKYPILTLKTFEEDPFRAIMEIGKQLKEIEETPGRNIIGEELYTKMWKAIIETMKCWGANTMVKRGVSNIPGPGILRKPRRSRIVGSQQEETG